jgi:predicted Fe-S protein YdhL (DUF1289 family)
MDNNTGYCQGCARTIDEIGSWSIMSRDEKLAVLAQLESRLFDQPQDND